MGDGTRYEHKTVKALRGTDRVVAARWEKRGWELVEQTPGTMQTVLTFRRPKPRLTRNDIALGALVVVLVAAITIGALTEGDDDKAPAGSSSGTTGTASRGEAKDATLTAQTNADFAALLAGPVQGPGVDAFVEKYHLRTVSFDGFVEEVYNADYDEESAFLRAGKPGAPIGPRFQISEYYRSEGAAQIEALKKGQRVSVTAGLGMYGDDYSRDTFTEETGRMMVVLVDQKITLR